MAMITPTSMRDAWLEYLEPIKSASVTESSASVIARNRGATTSHATSEQAMNAGMNNSHGAPNE